MNVGRSASALLIFFKWLILLTEMTSNNLTLMRHSMKVMPCWI